MSDKVGVGLIGCGGMGSHHARNLAEIEGAHLRGFADVRSEAAQQLQSGSRLRLLHNRPPRSL